MHCIALFKEDGERYTSIIKDIHFDDETKKAEVIKKLRIEAAENGYDGELIDVEINEEDQELYATNEYIRDPATGKPILRPPYIPTTEDKANAVATEYGSRIAELKDMLATATLAGDDETVAELRNENADLMAEYQAALEVIGNEEAL